MLLNTAKIVCFVLYDFYHNKKNKKTCMCVILKL